jgi:hypothetical protein
MTLVNAHALNLLLAPVCQHRPRVIQGPSDRDTNRIELLLDLKLHDGAGRTSPICLFLLTESHYLPWTAVADFT